MKYSGRHQCCVVLCCEVHKIPPIFSHLECYKLGLISSSSFTPFCGVGKKTSPSFLFTFHPLRSLYK
ncbi:hypothetical protein vseg_002243 [Gypsophila vaccaria]